MAKIHKRKIVEYAGGLFSNGAGTALGLVNQLLFARLLGIESYGLLTLTLTVVLLPLSLADLGVGVSMPRFLAIYTGEKDYGKIHQILKDSAMFTLLASLVLMSGLFLLAEPLSGWMNVPEMKEPLLCFALFVPALYLNRWALGALNGLGENGKNIALESIALQAGITVFSIGAWLLSESLTLTIAGTGLSYLVTGVLGLYFTAQKIKKVPKRGTAVRVSFREIILHGIPINITALGQRLFRRGDILVVGALLGANAVGLYQAAYTLSSGIKRLITPINSLALFYMGRSAGKKREDMILRHYEAAVQTGLCLSLPAYLIFIIMAKDILFYVFGPEYADAAVVLQILSIGFAAFTSIGPMGSLFNVLGKNWLRMWIMFTLSVVNILLNIVFVNMIGLSGAAISTATSFVLLNVIFHFLAKRWISTHRISVNTFAVWGIAILMTVVLYVAPFKEFWMAAAASFGGALIVFFVGARVAYRSFQEPRLARRNP